MSVVKNIFLLLVFFSMVNCKDTKLNVQELEEFGITMEVNDDIVIQNNSPVEDYLVLNIKLSENNLVAYVGNQPDFKQDSLSLKSTAFVKSKDGFRLIMYSWMESDSLFSNHSLIDLSSSKEFPQFLHVSYSNVPSFVKKRFDEIINSISVKGN